MWLFPDPYSKRSVQFSEMDPRLVGNLEKNISAPSSHHAGTRQKGIPQWL
jgi:hypothetical protein